ncbi:hypothetical protein DVH24_030892 [Malus domestica]|uniref:glutathione transferase n=1 Tax=Malus domestica TaxID=3750 RepID=A0A498HC03_MALDO|nr:hypothetical protein DVH24_030892 [Malus domestica]
MLTTAKIHPAASAVLSSSIKHHLRPPPNALVFRTNPNSLRRRGTTRTLTVAMVAPLDVCAKASTTVPNKLGDCPFCQRVLLTLEEKHLPYDLKLVDLGNKPECGSKIFSTFIGFLKSKDPKDGTEQALLKNLALSTIISKKMVLLSMGKRFLLLICRLDPKIALGHFKDWSIPDSLPYVKSYMKSIFSLDSFVKTSALKEDVIAGWRPKVLDVGISQVLPSFCFFIYLPPKLSEIIGR